MKTAIIVFPASNCDRDAADAIKLVTGTAPAMVWHGDTDIPPSDLIILPGGFSYGDYLRSGAMAARSPIMREVIARAEQGTTVLGICNGFQILTEAGLLPGAFLQNASLKFICKPVPLQVMRTDLTFTAKFAEHPTYAPRFPVANHEGNYFASAETLAELNGENRIVFRYMDNPNGSVDNIAGICNAKGNVLGLMPHPERVVDPVLGATDGRPLFESLLEALS